MPKVAFTYLAGTYEIKYKGRGVILSKLNSIQAKVLFQLMEKNLMEIESIKNIIYK